MTKPDLLEEIALGTFLVHLVVLALRLVLGEPWTSLSLHYGVLVPAALFLIADRLRPRAGVRWR